MTGIDTAYNKKCKVCIISLVVRSQEETPEERKKRKAKEKKRKKKLDAANKVTHINITNNTTMSCMPTCLNPLPAQASLQSSPMYVGCPLSRVHQMARHELNTLLTADLHVFPDAMLSVGVLLSLSLTFSIDT